MPHQAIAAMPLAPRRVTLSLDQARPCGLPTALVRGGSPGCDCLSAEFPQGTGTGWMRLNHVATYETTRFSAVLLCLLRP